MGSADSDARKVRDEQVEETIDRETVRRFIELLAAEDRRAIERSDILGMLVSDDWELRALIEAAENELKSGDAARYAEAVDAVVRTGAAGHLDLSRQPNVEPPSAGQDPRLGYNALLQAAALPAPRGEPDEPSDEWRHLHAYISNAIYRAEKFHEKEAEISWLLEKLGLSDHDDVRELFDLALGLYRLALKEQSPLNAYRAEVVVVDLTNGMVALARHQHLRFSAGAWIPESDA